MLQDVECAAFIAVDSPRFQLRLDKSKYITQLAEGTYCITMTMLYDLQRGSETLPLARPRIAIFCVWMISVKACTCVPALLCARLRLLALEVVERISLTLTQSPASALNTQSFRLNDPTVFVYIGLCVFSNNFVLL